MKIDKKELPKNQVELLIEIENKEYQKFLERSAERMAKESKIAGFRPGKAPYEIVKQKLGENAILQNALDEILTHFYFEAVVQEKLEPISQPKIDIEKLAPGNPIKFKAVLNILPKIELADLDKIKIKTKEIKADPKEIEKAIDTMLEYEAKETASNEKVKKDNKVEVDFTVKIDGVAIEGGNEKNYPLIIGKGQMIPGFEEELIGKEKGEEVNFKLNFPKEYHNKNIEGKEADFTVKINAIFNREIPEANDEWAKKLQAKDLTDLKKKIEENYLKEEGKKQERENEMNMINEIIQKSKIGEFSEDLVKQEAQKMVQELQHEISHRGIKFEDYLLKLGKKIEEIEKDFMPQAQKRLESSLIIRKVIDEQKLKVEDKELEQEIVKAKMMYGQDEKALKHIESGEYKNYTVNILLNKKVMKFLSDKILEPENVKKSDK